MALSEVISPSQRSRFIRLAKTFCKYWKKTYLCEGKLMGWRRLKDRWLYFLLWKYKIKDIIIGRSVWFDNVDGVDASTILAPLVKFSGTGVQLKGSESLAIVKIEFSFFNPIFISYQILKQTWKCYRSSLHTQVLRSLLQFHFPVPPWGSWSFARRSGRHQPVQPWRQQQQPQPIIRLNFWHLSK